MSRKLTIAILVGSVIWWLFPDIFPGPIDDLIAFVVSVITGLNLITAKAKELKETSALLLSDSTTQSS